MRIIQCRLLLLACLLLRLPSALGVGVRGRQKQTRLRRRSLKAGSGSNGNPGGAGGMDGGGNGAGMNGGGIMNVNKNSGNYAAEAISADEEMVLGEMTVHESEDEVEDSPKGGVGAAKGDGPMEMVEEDSDDVDEPMLPEDDESATVMLETSMDNQAKPKAKKTRDQSKKMSYKLAKATDKRPKGQDNKSSTKLTATTPGFSEDAYMQAPEDSIDELRPVVPQEESVDETSSTPAPVAPDFPTVSPIETLEPTTRTTGPPSIVPVTDPPIEVTDAPVEVTQAPATDPPVEVPVTEAPADAPDEATGTPTGAPTEASTQASETEAPATEAPETEVPATEPPIEVTDPPFVTLSPTVAEDTPESAPTGDSTGGAPVQISSPSTAPARATDAPTVSPSEPAKTLVPTAPTCPTAIMITGTLEYNFVFADREPTDAEIESVVDATLDYFVDLFREDYGDSVVEISGNMVSSEFDFGPPPIYTMTFEAIIPFSECAPPLDEVNNLLDLSDTQYEEYLTEYVFPIEPAGQHIFVLAARVEFEGSASYVEV